MLIEMTQLVVENPSYFPRRIYSRESCGGSQKKILDTGGYVLGPW
jgi:hypothetical protein